MREETNQPDRCLVKTPDLIAATERDEAPKDSAMPRDTDDLVEQLNENVVELGTVPAVGVEVVCAFSWACSSSSTR